MRLTPPTRTGLRFLMHTLIHTLTLPLSRRCHAGFIVTLLVPHILNVISEGSTGFVLAIIWGKTRIWLGFTCACDWHLCLSNPARAVTHTILSRLRATNAYAHAYVSIIRSARAHWALAHTFSLLSRSHLKLGKMVNQLYEYACSNAIASRMHHASHVYVTHHVILTSPLIRLIQ
jgi:hypothetical protein